MTKNLTPEISNSANSNVASDSGKAYNRRSSWQIAKDLPSSLLYATKGLNYAFSSQRNLELGFTVRLLYVRIVHHRNIIY